MPTSKQVEKARDLMTEHVAQGCCCEKRHAIYARCGDTFCFECGEKLDTPAEPAAG